MATAGLPAAFIDWELAGPIAPLTELAFVGWLNARLFDDVVCAKEGHPPANTRIGQLNHLLDGYELPGHERRSFVRRLLDVAVLTCASDVEEADIDEDGARQPWLVWGVAWRARSAAWLIRNRAEIARTIRVDEV